MRVLVAPDKFKGSLTAAAAADAIACGVRRARPDAEVEVCPVADGGEGTVDALVAATGGAGRTTRVSGPLGDPVDAVWGMLGDGCTACIEMAAASGLILVAESRRDPTRTTTFGVGELIRTAMDAGVSRVVLGIGGSATTDGGCGAAQALGVRFYRGGSLITEPISGGMLRSIDRLDASGLDRRLLDRHVRLEIACDVTNPLTGPDGAARVFGPQKGATAAQIDALDAGLAHLASLVGFDPATPGAGAAGGLGYGAMALLGGKPRRGVDLVLDAVRFDERLSGCDLCITGEGRFDASTLSGKVVAGVSAGAARRGVRVVALVGSVGPGAERAGELGVERVVPIGEGLACEESMRRAGELLTRAAAAAVA